MNPTCLLSDKNKLNIAICDDEPLAIDFIAFTLQNWAKMNHYILHISTFASAEQFLFEYASNKDFDILFLDIQMGNMNGIELARKIRLNNANVQIIFITALADYISEGYEVSALHYLVKPVRKEKLFSVMDRAVLTMRKREPFLLLTMNQTLSRVPVSSVISAEAFAHYVLVTAQTGTCELRENISVLSEQLGNDFVRPHRSYLVNLRYIHSISKTEILLDTGVVIPLSRYNYQKVNQAFINYYKGQWDNGTY